MHRSLSCSQSSVGSTRLRRLLSPIFGSPLAPRCRGNGRMPRRPTPRQRVDPLAGTRDVPAPLTPPMGRTVYGEVWSRKPVSENEPSRILVERRGIRRLAKNLREPRNVSTITLSWEVLHDRFNR